MASPNGSNLNKAKGTLIDNSGNVWTRSNFGAKKGSDVKKGAAATSFPGGACMELWFRDGKITGSRYGNGWYVYNGSSWVVCNPTTDM